jgi:hypothetical protein
MSPADDTGLDDERLTRYLLGLLSREQAERIDEASIVDDVVAARLGFVEHDLVDAYVRGALSPELRAAFESHYMASPHRRQQVAWAETFLRAVDRTTEARAADSRASRRSWLMWGLSAASAVLFVASGALVVQTGRLERGLGTAQQQRVALERRARDLERQVTELRAAQAAVEGLERVRKAAVAAASVRPAIRLALLPQTRAIGAMARLAIPSGAEAVGFDLRLESNELPQYQAALRDPSVNRIVWRGPWVPAPSPGSPPSVQVVVPASVLQPQHYSLDLVGRRAGSKGAVVGSYAFEVVSR